MCMRPLHPLLSPTAPNRTKKKKRVRAPLVRARRQRIDPTKYGSVHISGVLLDTPAIVVPSSPKTVQMAPPTSELSHIQKADERMKEGTQNALGVEPVALPKAAKSKEIEKAFTAERARNLALLSRLFGDKDVWEGHEDDVGGEAEASEPGEYDEDGDIALGPTRQGPETVSVDLLTPVNVGETSSSPSISSYDQPEESASIPEQQTEVKRLKDLFAPAAEPGT